MKASRIVWSIIAVGAFLGGMRASYAAYVSAAGTMCQTQTPYDPTLSPTYYDQVSHQVNGSVNQSTTRNAVYTCPLPLGTSTTSHVVHSGAILYYKDYSQVDNFWCEVYDGFNDGAVYFSNVKYTCSGAGGCPDATQSYTGPGYLSWSSAELTTQTVDQWLNGNYGIVCGVPKYNVNASWVDTYYAY